MKIFKILFIPLIVFLSYSCSPEKRIARIVKRHPELIKKDTVWSKDTLVTTAVKHDSLFHYYQPDTVYIKEGKMTVKYIFNKDSTVYIQGKCDADTIIKYYPIQVNSLSVEKELTWADRFKIWIFNNWWWVFAICWVLWKIFGKFLKAKFFIF